MLIIYSNSLTIRLITLIINKEVNRLFVFYFL